MAATQPLKGIELIDCAKANAVQGAEVAAQLCGYGQDISSFQMALTQAGQHMGIKLDDIKDLITEQSMMRRTSGLDGLEIAPDSPGEL
jgi:hypothetical protein